MCGRFDRHRPVSDFLEVIEAPDLIVQSADSVAPSYNVAPSREAAVVCTTDTGSRLKALTWGFVPAWAKDPKLPKPINARAETLGQKPMFRDGFRASRCLVFCDGYFEWQRQSDGTKQPFYITLEDGAPFVMAGLWARNTTLTAQPIESFCVITTEASEFCSNIHPRMPMILDRAHHQEWLKASSLDLDTATAMLRPSLQRLRLSPVSRFVNSPANDSPQCISPISQA
jgi:putative SOS response-associated peptidase YedK